MFYLLSNRRCFVVLMRWTVDSLPTKALLNRDKPGTYYVAHSTLNKLPAALQHPEATMREYSGPLRGAPSGCAAAVGLGHETDTLQALIVACNTATATLAGPSFAGQRVHSKHSPIFGGEETRSARLLSGRVVQRTCISRLVRGGVEWRERGLSCASFSPCMTPTGCQGARPRGGPQTVPNASAGGCWWTLVDAGGRWWMLADEAPWQRSRSLRCWQTPLTDFVSSPPPPRPSLGGPRSRFERSTC
jgi:hypothetical protein